MPEVLYLDTARLGQMSPRACRASVDFARLASEHGSTLYTEDLLRHGISAWPKDLILQYPGLADWNGVTSLKENLRAIAGADPHSEVLLSARSAVLMKFAARLMFAPCRNVMITDLTWPTYERILRRESRGQPVTRLPIRRDIFGKKLPVSALIERIATSFQAARCDGLFLPLVDNLGIKLPIQEIVNRINDECELRFVAVDGAQAIGHIPIDFSADYCDFMLAGCHKWLRAGTPMGIGFFGSPRSRSFVADSLSRWKKSGAIDDPLLAFSGDLESGHRRRFGETVPVSALFTSSGAILDALDANRTQPEKALGEIRKRIVEIARQSGWHALLPQAGFESRIIILRSTNESPRDESAEELRRRLFLRGVAVTAYSEQVLRVSIPQETLSEAELRRLNAALS